MATTIITPTVFHADQEHSGARATVLALFLIGLALTFFVASFFLRSLSSGILREFWLILSCTIALILGLAIAAVGERIIKRSWPSGRKVVVNNSGMEVSLSAEKTLSIRWSNRMLATRWWFALEGYRRGGREKRVSGSYYCLACQIQQDEQQFIVHSYLPPKLAKGLMELADYHEIRPADYYEGRSLQRMFTAPARPTLPTSLFSGKDGRYWLAERRRWNDGLELVSDDFATFMTILETNLVE